MIDAERFRGGGSNTAASLHVLEGKGLKAAVTNYGARLVALETDDVSGAVVNVALGFQTIAEYVADTAYHGATIGRYANRIAHGRCAIGGLTYDLSQNEGTTTLHGGREGFDRRYWRAQPAGHDAVRFELTSPDGDQGFPGVLNVAVTYRVEDERALRIDYEARCDRTTVTNLTNHTYFNLGGPGSETITDHILLIGAASYLPVTATMIPTGEIASVVETPFDFRNPREIAAEIDSGHAQLDVAGGFDHTFVLDGGVTTEVRPVARLTSPRSGIGMTVLTTEPGLQLYTGNRLEGRHRSRSGVCLEAEHFPNSPNDPAFPSTMLAPGRCWRSTTIYRFAPPA